MAGSGIPYVVETALGRIAEELDSMGSGKPPVWLLGGSCGLLLHGVQLSAAPRDIDLYCDLEDTAKLHQALLRYTVCAPEEDHSGGCYSLRGLYFIGEVKVELVGGFRIGGGSGQYSVDIRTLQPYAPKCTYEGVGRLALMPLVHELIFNLLRGRDERCHAIAELIKRDAAGHLPLLEQLIEENHLKAGLQPRLDELLGISESLRI
ncbi:MULTISPECIES: hypothetical protein [unclassified Paenibacillus]|uniref:hypothetical protein n=1 Tax=unclassified Paenibacillus TaxID=185978 RepID=UPI0003E21A05|nr:MULTISPECIES: hypothetical protein [unclassified Paenibacillus]ETT44112.1 hypothetical protein C162_23000 [Paenibacillus sp. FSL R7-269]OMF96332.1 hypothetical protein BK147_13190 [Paenibacillus sp. FSL R7-0337]